MGLNVLTRTIIRLRNNFDYFVPIIIVIIIFIN